MSEARIRMFLADRDAARARGDLGAVRNRTFELRALGVPDDATLTEPLGRSPEAASGPENARETPPKPPARRHRRPKCEHGRIPEHCEDCAAAEIDDALEPTGVRSA